MSNVTIGKAELLVIVECIDETGKRQEMSVLVPLVGDSSMNNKAAVAESVLRYAMQLAMSPANSHAKSH